MNKFQKLLWPLWRSRRKKIQIKGKKRENVHQKRERVLKTPPTPITNTKTISAKAWEAAYMTLICDLHYLWKLCFSFSVRTESVYPCVNQLTFKATWWWWIKCDPALVDKHHPHSNVSRAKSIIYTTTSIS